MDNRVCQVQRLLDQSIIWNYVIIITQSNKEDYKI